MCVIFRGRAGVGCGGRVEGGGETDEGNFFLPRDKTRAISKGKNRPLVGVKEEEGRGEKKKE